MNIARQTRKRRIVQLNNSIDGMFKFLRASTIVRANTNQGIEGQWIKSTTSIMMAIWNGVKDVHDPVLYSRLQALLLDYEEDLNVLPDGEQKERFKESMKRAYIALDRLAGTEKAN